MKKKLVLLLTGVMTVSMLLAGCGSSDDDSSETPAADETEEDADDAGENDEAEEEAAEDDNSLQEILDKGELVLGLDPAFPPMGFTDEDQELVGFDIDVAKEVAERLEVELVLQPIDWTTKEQELDTKNIDCIWNGFTLTDERAEKHQCSVPYMQNTQVVVVLSDSDIESLDDLEGKQVTIQAGSTAEDAINDNPDFLEMIGDPITVNDNVQAMLELKQSASDAVVMDRVVAMYYMKKNAGEFKVLDEYLADEEYVIGFRKGEYALCEKVEEILSEMAADGTLAEISEAWFGEDITMIQ